MRARSAQGGRGGRPLRAALAVLSAGLGVLALWATGAGTRSAAGLASAAACVWATAALAALASPGRGGVWTLAGAAVFTAGAGAAAELAAHWMRAEPDTLHALLHWLLGAPLPLLPALAAVALGGLVFGRLASGRRLERRVDPVHWILGALLLALPGVVLLTGGALSGAWGARAAAALIAAVAGAFWPRWAAAEPRPVSRRVKAGSWRLSPEAAVRLRARRAAAGRAGRRLRAGKGRAVPRGAAYGAGPPVAVPGRGGAAAERSVRAPASVAPPRAPAVPAPLRPEVPAALAAAALPDAGPSASPSTGSLGPGSSSAARQLEPEPAPMPPRHPAALAPSGDGRAAAAPLPPRHSRRRRSGRGRVPTVAPRGPRPTLRPPGGIPGYLRTLRAAATRIPEHGGALPLAVRTASPRSNALRLAALYTGAALIGGPALLFCLVGRRAAWLWLLPTGLPPGARLLALVLAAAAPAAGVALALRTRLLHPLELALPRPKALYTALGAAGAALVFRLGLGAAYGPAGSLAGSLLLAHHVWTTAAATCLLLPAAQAAFYFGLLQTRLAEVLPPWAAFLLPAAAFALSGPVTGAPLPGLPLGLALGLWLVWLRGRCGATGVAIALVVGNAAAIAMAVR